MEVISGSLISRNEEIIKNVYTDIQENFTV